MHTKRFSNYNQKGPLSSTQIYKILKYMDNNQKGSLSSTNLQNPKNGNYMDTILNVTNLVWF